MKDNLSEEEMRHALFGTKSTEAAPAVEELRHTSDQQHVLKARRAPISRSPKLRVTLRVTSEFEGTAEMLIYEASTLSSLIAEQEAKAEAKKGVWGAMEPKTNVSSESHRKGAFRSPAHPPGITL